MKTGIRVIKCKVDGVRLEECQGVIPDIFRSGFFGDIKHPSLPRSNGTDEEFGVFLAELR